MEHLLFWGWIIFLIVLMIGSGVAFAFYKEEGNSFFGFFLGADQEADVAEIIFLIGLVLLVISLLVWGFYLRPKWNKIVSNN